ncbi:unnamed protein product, partial [Protopolystoma xenopodis]
AGQPRLDALLPKATALVQLSPHPKATVSSIADAEAGDEGDCEAAGVGGAVVQRVTGLAHRFQALVSQAARRLQAASASCQAAERLETALTDCAEWAGQTGAELGELTRRTRLHAGVAADASAEQAVDYSALHSVLAGANELAGRLASGQLLLEAALGWAGCLLRGLADELETPIDVDADRLAGQALEARAGLAGELARLKDWLDAEVTRLARFHEQHDRLAQWLTESESRLRLGLTHVWQEVADSETVTCRRDCARQTQLDALDARLVETVDLLAHLRTDAVRREAELRRLQAHVEAMGRDASCLAKSDQLALRYTGLVRSLHRHHDRLDERRLDLAAFRQAEMSARQCLTSLRDRIEQAIGISAAAAFLAPAEAADATHVPQEGEDETATSDMIAQPDVSSLVAKASVTLPEAQRRLGLLSRVGDDLTETGNQLVAKVVESAEKILFCLEFDATRPPVVPTEFVSDAETKAPTGRDQLRPAADGSIGMA